MIDRKYPLHPYFQEMPSIGSVLPRVLKKNIEELKEQEEIVAKEVQRVKEAGKPTEKMNEKGEWTAWQRIEYLVEPGTWCPLHTIYDPNFNEEGNTASSTDLAKSAQVGCYHRIQQQSHGRSMASGPADNMLRVTDIAKRLHLPLVVLNCSGAAYGTGKMLPDRRGSGPPSAAELRSRHSIIVGIYRTSHGGGYHYQPTILMA